ncbi:Asparaginase [Hahella chejuensis KCTC 2396]|uniref:Isoaspartyl peptidase n=2 Tax=Hahella chejuensis (strain KCTC 2396) TaxID=349521 RepID=Q2S7M9_HAHCH|nr:isoaspartyl peptidase/L-asparaginase [Hahella chejuensis]ABC33345.1 Asparaginase [Hahella chejuensis KCTC 2396]
MTQPNRYAIAIHGGAGTLSKGMLTEDQENEVHAALRQAVMAGKQILAQGGTSLDAVEAAVRELENSEWFNAGKGSVYNYDGDHELDASIMDGATLKAGAVAGVRNSPNPVSVARAVMNKSEHVLLAGEGADRFARAMGLPQVENSWFGTPMRHSQWRQAQDKAQPSLEPGAEDYKFGTVGAVAIDQAGNLAAATSTGGMTNKKYGRVGDSPLIGCGAYADNRSCAVSTTGHGEYFIRHVVAHEVCARYRYLGESLQQCAQQVLFEELQPRGGEGGLIAIDHTGAVTLNFNTEGMYRGWSESDGEIFTGIYGDDAVRSNKP